MISVVLETKKWDCCSGTCGMSVALLVIKSVFQIRSISTSV